MGIGGVVCAGAVAGASIAFSAVGDVAVDTVIGPPTDRDDH
jgi:hypothetical protein